MVVTIHKEKNIYIISESLIINNDKCLVSLIILISQGNLNLLTNLGAQV